MRGGGVTVIGFNAATARFDAAAIVTAMLKLRADCSYAATH